MANRWILHVKKYQAAHPECSYKEALVKSKMSYKKDTKSRKKDTKSRTTSYTTSYKKDTKSRTTKGSGILDVMPKKVKSMLKKYGAYKIEKIYLYKTPLSTSIMKLLKIATLNDIRQQMKNAGYDSLFHLYMIVKLENGVELLIEKNERVVISTRIPRVTDKTQYTHVLMRDSLTLYDLFSNLEKKVSPRQIWRYTVDTYNCQRFLYDILLSSNLITQNNKSFILQRVNQLLPYYVKTLSNVSTDIAALANYIMKGGSKKSSWNRI